MANPPANSRDENIQILRFFAAALVLFTHITFYIHDRIDANFAMWHSGEVGVPIFFIISGFVMYLSGGKLPQNSQGGKLFIRRRLARIFPLYWFFTAIKIAIALLGPGVYLHNRPSAASIAASLVLFPMFNNEGEVRPLHGVGWTLLHEMLFYYIFTLALFLRRTPIVFCTAVILFLWLSGYFLPSTSAVAEVCFNKLNLLFVAGMFLAMFHQHGPKIPLSFAIAIWLLSFSAMLTPHLSQVMTKWAGGFQILPFFVVLSSLSITIPSLLFRLKRILVRLGDSSYSLYLFHPMAAPPLCVVFYKLHIHSPLVVILLTAVVCIVFGHWVHLFVETRLSKAFTRLIDKCNFSRKNPESPI